ncbi:MFS transporter [Dacryopinax primogenitus]|uniref:MFS transporter n=1 Tax=Dacryopinax primogenitus (strain DJM 731) TaxID=1858805 RepID=M5GDN6_DACPD|nr:MFS transporter [Dacryopinax primogenitus]EJU04672.1 MFS transporter [Dacryopinax primogenitus]
MEVNNSVSSKDAASIKEVKERIEVAGVAPEPVTVDVNVEKSICLKLDTCLFNIRPLLTLMYLCNALDKGNVANAKTDGRYYSRYGHRPWLRGNQYNVLLSVFFVPFVLSAFPVTVVGKIYEPSLVLPLLMLSFGAMTLLMAATQNFAGMMTVRWFLGMAESGFFPLVIYYLTTFYRRGELARRLGFFYAAFNVASAFSGLLSFGVFQLHSGSLQAWRYLFLIEGAAAILISAVAYCILPRSPATARFLSKEERIQATLRIQHDSSAIIDEKLSLRDALRVFLHPVAWVWMSIEIFMGIPMQSVALFLPQIVQRLGYGTVKTNLFTVAPNVAGAVALIVLAYISDYTRLRFAYLALALVFPFVGFILYATLDLNNQLNIAYFATFLMCMGSSAPSVLLATWYNNNTPGEGRCSALTAVGIPLGNLMGVVTSNIFLPKDAPTYMPALVTSAVSSGLGVLTALLLGVWMHWDNWQRNICSGEVLRVEDVSTEALHEGPDNPSFRWFL